MKYGLPHSEPYWAVIRLENVHLLLAMSVPMERFWFCTGGPTGILGIPFAKNQGLTFAIK